MLDILYADIRTFEVLLRTYEVREAKMDQCQTQTQTEEGTPGARPFKRKQRASEASNWQADNSGSPSVMARPSGEAKGHTGYLTFARLKCIA